MESFWLNDKKNWVVLSHFMIFWEASPDPIPIILTFFIHLCFFVFCYKTSLVLSSLHAWQGHILAFWMGRTYTVRFWSRIHVIQQKFLQNPMAFPVKDGSSMVPQEKTAEPPPRSRRRQLFPRSCGKSIKLRSSLDLSMKQINDVSFKHSKYIIITVHMYILYNN